MTYSRIVVASPQINKNLQTADEMEDVLKTYYDLQQSAIKLRIQS